MLICSRPRRSRRGKRRVAVRDELRVDREGEDRCLGVGQVGDRAGGKAAAGGRGPRHARRLARLR